jgi:inhibitor of KinA sporulation pathway (predicted exonuclease)
MRFLALDLEIEQPFTRADTTDSKTDVPKLIQVGIVVFELAPAEPTILESQTMNIQYDQPLSQFIKTLTSISDEDVNMATDGARDALRRLSDLRGSYDASRQIVEWGQGDVEFLLQEAESNKDEFTSMFGFGRSTINVKVLYQLYAMMNGLKRQGGLSASMGKLGLQFKGTKYNGKNKGKHWAEADALNTARIFNKLCNLIKKD